MKNIIVKDNALINASYNLELTEQRLLLIAIIETRSQNKKITADSVITITAESYIKLFKTHRNTAYQALKNASKNLFDRKFSYQTTSQKGNNTKATSRWIQSVYYTEAEAVISIKLSSDVIPLITNLESHFTSYEIEQVSALTSIYAIRIYELVMAWKSTKRTPMFTVKELKEKLGLTQKDYPRMDNFKRKVLDFSVNQINKKTDIKITYHQEKSGRKIIGFYFSLSSKTISTKDIKQHALPGETYMDVKKRLLSKDKHLPPQ